MSMAQRVMAHPVETFQSRPSLSAGLRTAVDSVSILRSHHRIMIVDPAHQWYDSIRDRLNDLCRLNPGWDGYKAEPVAFDIANFTLRMMEAICGPDVPVPSIVPGPSGDLQVEWHVGDVDIELHVRAPNNVHAWRCSPATDMDGEELELTIDFTLVAGWIKDLVRSSGAAQAAAA